jgi:SAM-dependent methyltransferase
MKNILKWKPSRFVYSNNKLIASRDTREVQISSRLMVDLIAELYNLNIKKFCSRRLCDLGCGKVPLYGVYKSYIKENICVDWKNTSHKSEYVDFELDLTRKLPFKKSEFDTIILSDVLEHIPNPENLFKEMKRILKKKGKILLNTPFYYWIHEEPHDYFRYTRYSLMRFARHYKFKIIQLNVVGGMPEVIADILAKNFVKISFIGKTLSSFVQKVAYLFVKNTKFGKKLSFETTRYFPLGYFMVLEKN